MSEWSMPAQVDPLGQASTTEQKGFDRSQVFMICTYNFDDHRRLCVTMLGGHIFEIDSRKCPYDLDHIADWLMERS